MTLRRAVVALLNRYYKLLPYLPGKNMAAKIGRRTAEAIDLPDYAGVPTRPTS